MVTYNTFVTTGAVPIGLLPRTRSSPNMSVMPAPIGSVLLRTAGVSKNLLYRPSKTAPVIFSLMG